MQFPCPSWVQWRIALFELGRRRQVLYGHSMGILMPNNDTEIVSFKVRSAAPNKAGEIKNQIRGQIDSKLTTVHSPNTSLLPSSVHWIETIIHDYLYTTYCTILKVQHFRFLNYILSYNALVQPVSKSIASNRCHESFHAFPARSANRPHRSVW